MKLPDPNYSVDFINKKGHWYDIRLGDGGLTPIRCPGVTGILGIIAKPALINWAKKESLRVVQDILSLHIGQAVTDNAWIEALIAEASARPKKILDEACDIGTKAHKFADLTIKKMSPVISPDIIVPISAFLDWWENTKLEFVSGDMPVASLKYGYGGRLDFLARDNRTLILGDFKTSSGIWPEYLLQVAAYVRALNEQYNVNCQDAIIIRFDKLLSIKPEFYVMNSAEIDDAFRGFLAAKELQIVVKRFDNSLRTRLLEV